MNYLRFSLLFGIITILLSSCSVKEAFTKNMVDEYDLTERSMKQLQFYTSDYIILKSNRSVSSQHIDDGKIISSKNNKNYQIIFEPRTKCVLESFDGENLFIRFEQGKDKFLKFAVRRNDLSGKYYLVADFSNGQKGEVQYEGKSYYIDSRSANSFLMVAVKKLDKTYGGTKVVKGMKVY